jgi:oligoribonuclease (3'-5' exoribonuclease)
MITNVIKLIIRSKKPIKFLKSIMRFNSLRMLARLMKYQFMRMTQLLNLRMLDVAIIMKIAILPERLKMIG